MSLPREQGTISSCTTWGGHGPCNVVMSPVIALCEAVSEVVILVEEIPLDVTFRSFATYGGNLARVVIDLSEFLLREGTLNPFLVAVSELVNVFHLVTAAVFDLPLEPAVEELEDGFHLITGYGIFPFEEVVTG